MGNEAMLNAEDLGFDAEDLKEAGLDKPEPATSAGNDPKKPELFHIQDFPSYDKPACTPDLQTQSDVPFQAACQES